MSAFVGGFDYLRILKVFLILFLFFFMNVLNQNGKVLVEMLAVSNSDATLRSLCNLKMMLPFLQVFEKLIAILL